MTILLIDVPNIAWRAFHTSQAFEDKVQGVLFGVFRTLLELQKRFQTEQMAFCFDGVGSKRKELFPGYKAHRQEKNKEKADERNQVGSAIFLLIDKLQKIGYRNLFCKEGFEADDLLASIIEQEIKKPTVDANFVVISSDTDLFQLLEYGDADSETLGIFQWLPIRKVLYGPGHFKEDFCGLYPDRWPEIKAIAGCKTDDIPGVPGVGNKTAAKFLAGQLSKNSKAYKAIVDNAHIKMANLPLVKLPFSGCPALKLVEDKPTRKGWAKVLKELGMSDLLGGF